MNLTKSMETTPIRCACCNTYRTLNKSIFNSEDDENYDGEQIISKGLELSAISPIFLYTQITGKSIDELIDDYKNNVTRKIKLSWISLLVNPLSIFYKKFDKTLQKNIMKKIKTDYLLLSENSNEKVSLNTIYRVLKENKALVDNLFDSTFHVLIGFLDDISIGSKIATIVGFHKLIISRNCLIKITISNHTVSYYNPGRHKLNHSKFFICWNNKTLLECSSSASYDDGDRDADYAFLTIDLPTALLNVLETKMLTENTNQEKLIWHHGTCHETDYCKKKEIKEEEKDIDDAEKDEQGDDENDIITPIISHSKLLRQKKSDRKVRWNNMHHLKNKSSRMKKGVFSTSS